MIHHPSRGSYHNVDSALELADLTTVVGTTIDRHYVKSLHFRCIFLKRLGNLNRQLTGRGQHQYLSIPPAHIDIGQQRQRKGGCLTGTGLCLTKHIPTL